jgi:2-oxoglutarate ferredoxin oxidoreductase subunit delta
MAEMKKGIQAKESKKCKKPPTIELYKAWCKACGLCAGFCPTGALARDEAGYPYVKNIDKCINCGLCEIRCPDFAITVSKKSQEGKGKKNEEKEEDGEEGTAPPGQRGRR